MTMSELKHCKLFDNHQDGFRNVIVLACVYFINEAFIVDINDNVYHVINNQIDLVDVLCKKSVVHFAYAYCNVEEQYDYHMLALTKSGGVFARGQNCYNQVNNSNILEITDPIGVGLRTQLTVSKMCPWMKETEDWKSEFNIFTQIGCGSAHSMAVTKYNTIICWGNNKFGQIGNGNKNTSVNQYEISPRNLINRQMTDQTNQTNNSKTSTCVVFVVILPLLVFFTIALGIAVSPYLFILILLLIPIILIICCCGICSKTTIEYGPSYFIKETAKVKSIACGAYHNLVLFDNGRVWGWGSNIYGQLGRIPSGCLLRPRPLLNNVESIATVNNHSLVLCKDKVLFAMGNNAHAQCGNYDQAEYSEPLRIEMDFVAIATIKCISMAQKDTGEIYAWGLYKFEQFLQSIYENMDYLDNFKGSSKNNLGQGNSREREKVLADKHLNPAKVKTRVKAFIIPEPTKVNCKSFNEFVSRYSSLTYFTVQNTIQSTNAVNSDETCVCIDDQGISNPLLSYESDTYDDVVLNEQEQISNDTVEDLIDESKLMIIEYDLGDDHDYKGNHITHNEFSLFSKCCVSPEGDLTVEDVKQTGQDNSNKDQK